MNTINTNLLPEVLSPAGSMESLVVAVRSGADAVYIGAQNFSARRNADNFTEDEIKQAVEFCHIRNVKVYLALNIMLKQSELKAAFKTALNAYNAGIDAVIIQDLGLARLIKEYIPNLEMHASTQMSVNSPAALEKLKQMGFSRVVAGREMSERQLKEFCNEAKRFDMQVEVFVHGALCMSVSGQCLLSSVLGARSGNRGLCAGPCRLPFAVENGNGYDLSLKDLSLFENIKQLKAMGVDSLKIEGRMKRPEYIAAATCACRMAVDTDTVDAELNKILKGVFTRSGFTNGYFEGKIGKDMFGIRTKDDIALSKETFSKIHERYRNERQSVEINFDIKAKSGVALELTVTDFKNTVTVLGDIPDIAKAKVATKEDIILSLSKLGGTPYKLKKINVTLDDNLFLSNASLNTLRRDALEQLSALRSRNTKNEVNCYKAISENKQTNTVPKLIARFNSFADIPNDISMLSAIIVPMECEIPKDMSFNLPLIADIPRLIFDEEKVYSRLCELKSQGFSGAYCQNLSAVVIAKKASLKVMVSPFLNACNLESIKSLETDFSTDAVTLSLETSLKDAITVSSAVPKGIVAYGHIPLMLLRVCPIKNGKDCKVCDGKGFITDRMGISFPLRCRNKEYTELLNSKPLYIADRVGELNGLDYIILYFTDENSLQAAKIIDNYIKALTYENEYTRGLYYRTLI